MEWFYVDSLRRQHSVEGERLPGLVSGGTVTKSTLVWNETLPDWRPCVEVLPELFPDHSPKPPVPGPEQLRQSGSVPFLIEGPASVPSEADPWAVASLVLGIAGLFCFGPLGLLAVICGHIALNAANEGRSSGASKGLAIAGLITGYLAVLLFAAFVLFFVFAFFSAAAP